MDLARAVLGELVEELVRKRRSPVLDGPSIPNFSRAAFEIAERTSKSSFTLAMDPSGRTTPPWLVPVCTEIFRIPVRGPRAF